MANNKAIISSIISYVEGVKYYIHLGSVDNYLLSGKVYLVFGSYETDEKTKLIRLANGIYANVIVD